MKVISEEEYLSINGACRQSIGDAALHKNKGYNSDKTWKRIVDIQAKKDHEILARREELRIEYKSKVESGELRPPTRIETLIQTARGNEDNASVQAARRILIKKEIDWNVTN